MDEARLFNAVVHQKQVLPMHLPSRWLLRQIRFKLAAAMRSRQIQKAITVMYATDNVFECYKTTRLLICLFSGASYAKMEGTYFFVIYALV